MNRMVTVGGDPDLRTLLGPDATGLILMGIEFSVLRLVVLDACCGSRK